MADRVLHDDYRLPAGVWPRRYELRVVADVAGRSFEGDVAIGITVAEGTDAIVLNAAGLEIDNARLQADDGSETVLYVSLDEALERVVFRPGREIGPGEHVLSCSFSAPISETLRGFYVSAFTDDAGEEKVIVSTHLEPADARRVFPCFDEPALKAVFSITLDVGDGLVAVSNSPEQSSVPLAGGGRRIVFADTMPMSSYLVAWAIGDFETTETVVADGVPLRVVVSRGKLHLTSFALEAAAHSLEWFHRYFDISYPAEKLDLVAIPDFAMGAMENLGCVTFREQDLLCDTKVSSIPELARIAETVEHEIAHMWFGDLVTMKWWNGIWLNEAFATFMSLLCLDDFRPEWKRWVAFAEERDVALQVDGLHSTRPIEFEVRAPDEADAMFDDLTYLKGGGVLRMVEQYLGPEAFREGVRRYLKEHAYANTETNELWDAIEAGAAGEPVRAILDSWVFQGGHPVLSARRDGEVLRLTASPFSYLPDSARPPGPVSAIGSKWFLPVRYEDRPGHVRSLLLTPDDESATLEVGQGPCVLDAGGSSTYRVCYEGSLFAEMVERVGELSGVERCNLVSDSWACTLAGRIPLSDFLTLVRALSYEESPHVWRRIAAALHTIDLAAAGTAEEELASFVRQLARPLIARLGYEEPVSDSLERVQTREVLIGLLGTLGADKEVSAECARMFERSGAGGHIPASMARAVLAVVVSAFGEHYFDTVLEGYLRPSDPLAEDRHLFALTAVREPGLAKRVLEMSLSEIRAQDGPNVLRALVRNRHVGAQAWGFVTEHFGELATRFPPHGIPRVIEGIPSLVAIAEGDDVLGPAVREFLAGRDFGGRQRLVDQSVEQQAVNARFVTATRSELGALLSTA